MKKQKTCMETNVVLYGAKYAILVQLHASISVLHASPIIAVFNSYECPSSMSISIVNETILLIIRGKKFLNVC